jgi:thiosulfate/3-mercaptopyruvate sulfurtransferase
MTPLVSTDWLAANLGNPELVVCDCSFYLPTDPRNAAALFAEARIPGARFFDIDAIKDTASDLPHMLPSPETFAELYDRLLRSAGPVLGRAWLVDDARLRP